MSFFTTDPADDRSDDDIAYAAAIDGAFGTDINCLEKYEADIEAVEVEMLQLSNTELALERHGVDASTFTILKSAVFMQDTALASLGLEALTTPVDGKTVQELACEGLGEKIKQKAAEWSAKILAFASRAAKAAGSALSAIWDRITNAAKALGEKTWDGTKSAGATIKAHPYKTIIVALGAVAAVMGVVAFAGTSLPVGTVTNGALDTFLTRFNVMIKSIKFPGFKCYTKVLVNGKLQMARVETAEQVAKVSGKIDVLGWTKNAYKAVVGQVMRYKPQVEAGLSKLWTKAIKPGITVAEKIFFLPKDIANYAKEKTGSRLVGWATEAVVSGIYYKFLFGVIGTIYRLIKSIVVGTMNMIADTFRSLVGAV